MGDLSMTACIGKTVVSVIFVAAADVNVFVPVAFFILVQLFVPVIIRQYVRCFQSLHMSVTDVRKRELVHWKNGFTIYCIIKTDEVAKKFPQFCNDDFLIIAKGH